MSQNDNSRTSDTAGSVATTARIDTLPTATEAGDAPEWSAPLWEDDWDGDYASFGGVDLCVATKSWPDGSADVLVAHAPAFDDAMPTAYAHRHGASGVTSLTVHGSAGAVVRTVIADWGPPQVRNANRKEC